MQSDKSKRRDSGFVKLRRGLREHIPLMSSNAFKLYGWLLLAAEWNGERGERGTYESNYPDIAQELRWNLRMLRRSINELRDGGYVAIVGAANQYENTLIRILKYDQEVTESGQDTGVLSKDAEDIGEDRAAATGVPSVVLSKPASNQNSKGLRPPKNLEEVKEVKKGTANAVRRRVDAELHLSIKPFSKSKKLQILLAEKIKQDEGPFSDWIEDARKRGHEHPFGLGERKAFAATGYTPDLKSPFLSPDFVCTVVEVYDENVGKDLAAGNLCSKILDRCALERKRNGGTGYYWPPDFQKHRDQLRAQERILERRSNSTLEARL